jgi:NTE family protein
MSKRALVLSGGGLFGAYEAGAWSALESHFHPDLVVGASIGALNAWAIAGGASSQELCQRWMNLNFDTITQSGRPIEDIFHTYQPRCDVCVVLTDVLRLRPRPFLNTQITARHLAASCAVPFILPSQRIDGVWYADGGLLNALPLAAALAQGATEIAAINVWAPLPWWWFNAARAFRLLTGNRIRTPKDVIIRLLTPKSFLGKPGDAFIYKHSNIERWIEQGRQDATKHFTPGMF